MCGIAGTYNLPELAGRTDGMLEEIAHRGPDAVGEFTIDAPAHVWFGQRRLTIIDLSDAANQPFRSNGLVINYNGEIFNYRELKAQLLDLGHTFRTTSDTEVLLEAWREWGPGCLPRLRGMFAFAILDEATGTMYLARDQLGIKPLLYHRRGDGIAFASEAKALVTGVGQELSVDPAGIVASMMYYWIPDRQSAYRGIEKLGAGHYAEIRPDGAFRIERFFDPVSEWIGNDPITTEELAEVIEDSVKAHLVADVPVGAFLSGGLDSSIITALAAKHESELACYTIRFRKEDSAFEAMPDDAHYARIVADLTGVPLTEIEIAPDIVDLLPKMVHTLDEPIGDAASINTFLISQAARDAGIKVLLSGMGADELFGGYRKHQANLMAARYRKIPGFIRSGLIEPVVDRLPVATANRGFRYPRWAKRFVGFASLPESAAFHRSYALFGRSEFADLLDPSLMPIVDDLMAEHDALYQQGAELDFINRMCFTDAQMFMVGLNLMYTDRSSMAASTEVRVPFVDVKVAKAAFSIEGDRKVVGSRRKAVLRDAAHNWLPENIIERPKGLFSAPLRSWIRGDLSPMIDDLVVNGSLVRDGVLRRQAVEKLVSEDRSGQADRSKELWQLLTLEVWLEQIGGRLGSVAIGK